MLSQQRWKRHSIRPVVPKRYCGKNNQWTFLHFFATPVLPSDMLATWAIPLQIYWVCTHFIWLFICCINCFFLLFLSSLHPFCPPSFILVAAHTGNIQQGRNMDCHTHRAFRKLKGWHTLFTFTVVRKTKQEERVYTHWELSEMVLPVLTGKVPLLSSTHSY